MKFPGWLIFVVVVDDDDACRRIRIIWKCSQ